MRFRLEPSFGAGHSPPPALTKLSRLTALAFALTACRADDRGGCLATTPRSVPVEAFVGPRGLQQRLTTLIDSAKTSLDVQMYLFSVKPLAERIVAAKQRGVAVRVILDPDEAGNPAVEPILTSGGVTFRQASPLYTYSHAKYLIVDRATTAIMSMNFNVDAMTNERKPSLQVRR